jgi:hypothetical protein
MSASLTGNIEIVRALLEKGMLIMSSFHDKIAETRSQLRKYSSTQVQHQMQFPHVAQLPSSKHAILAS